MNQMNSFTTMDLYKSEMTLDIMIKKSALLHLPDSAFHPLGQAIKGLRFECVTEGASVLGPLP